MTGSDFGAMLPGPVFGLFALLIICGGLLGLWKLIEIVVWLVKHVSVSIS